MYRPCVGLTACCECRCEYAKFGSFFPPTHSPILVDLRSCPTRGCPGSRVSDFELHCYHLQPNMVRKKNSPTKNSSRPLNILVFGDSQGDVGPTYKVLQDVLNLNNVANNVVNKAVGGTTACHWAADQHAIAKAAKSAFPDAPEGPDYVWYTAGGNDLAQDGTYHTCLEQASNDDEAIQCLEQINSKLMGCTISLFEGLWSVFPNARIGQYNYEVPCVEGGCLAAASQFIGGAYCKGEPQCMIKAMLHWQTIYVDALQKRYAQPAYTGMNILGAVQHASGVAGASRGHPVPTEGAKCEWMVGCVHPKYGTPTATAIGTALWDLWLKDAPPPGPSPPSPASDHSRTLSHGERAIITMGAPASLALMVAFVIRRCRLRNHRVSLRARLQDDAAFDAEDHSVDAEAQHAPESSSDGVKR